ncbi:protein kinase [Cystobacter fuscus]|nr:protein kinase [Cystobacter fuscus]
MSPDGGHPMFGFIPSRHRRVPPGTGQLLFREEGVEYEQIKCVGTGAYGELIFLAWRHAAHHGSTPVVVKSLGGLQPWKSHRRLDTEARLLSGLVHPGIARVLGWHSRGIQHFTVSEFIEGHSLTKLLGYAALRGRPLSEEFALYVCAQVAGALHAAHSMRGGDFPPWGLVHRNVCPDNIRVDRDGQPKLTHFDLARCPLPGRETTTGPSDPLGDRDYAAPERLCSRLARAKPEARIDLFSLGLVLLELLTHQHLYYVATLDQRVARLLLLLRVAVHPMSREEARSVDQLAIRAELFRSGDVEYAARNVSEPVKAVVHTLLRQDPGERYVTAAEVQAELLRCLKGRTLWYGAWRAAREVRQLVREVARLPHEAQTVGSYSARGGHSTRSTTTR